MRVNMHEAKTTLSRLVARAEAGEEIILTRRNVPIARIVPFEEPHPRRFPGFLKGVFEVPDSFFDPLSPEELGLWEGVDDDGAKKSD